MRFIVKGADLRVPVPRVSYSSRSHSFVFDNKPGTPLDVRFEFSATPDEARTLGAEWLGLLALKGHNVVAYLKKEMMLHSMQQQMNYGLSFSSYEHWGTKRDSNSHLTRFGPAVGGNGGYTLPRTYSF